jgi:hypothetical protein
MKTEKSITEQIREIKRYLRYEDGKVFWKENRGAKTKKGDRAGSLNSTGYRQIQLNYRSYCEHRIIWLLVHGVWPDNHLDHINGDRLDNRIENLRDVTHRDNLRAFRKPTRGASSQYRGVSWHKQKNQWCAEITFNGKSTFIGLFKCEVAAAEAWDAAAMAHGYDAQALNFKPTCKK